MTYAEIDTKIQTLTGRSDSTFTGLVLDWTNDVIRTICNKRNWFFLRATSSVTINADDDDYTLPTDYKDDYAFYITENDSYHFIDLKNKRDVLRGSNAVTKGMPKVWYLNSTTEYKVSPIPDQEYTATFDYWKKLAVFEDTEDESNWLTIEIPDLIIAAILAEAFVFLQEEERAGVFEQKKQMLLRTLKHKHVDWVLAQEETLIPKSGPNSSTFKEKPSGSF